MSRQTPAGGVDWVRETIERLSPYDPALRLTATIWVDQPPAVDRFGRPYPRRKVPIRVRLPLLLDLEAEGFDGSPRWGRRDTTISPIASKRYTPAVIPHERLHVEIHNGHPVLVRAPVEAPRAVAPSEFALGHLLDPRDPFGGGDSSWIEDACQWWMFRAPDPDWLDRPVLAVITLTRFEDLERLTRSKGTRGRRMNPRPGAKVILAYTDPMLGKTEDGRQPLAASLLTPGWSVGSAEWFDWNTGEPIGRVRPAPSQATESSLRVGRPLFLRTFRSLLVSYFRHPESKAVDLEGHICGPDTAGTLNPRPTEAYEAVAIGREASYGPEVGVTRAPAYAEFPDGRSDQSERRARLVLKDVAGEPGGRASVAAELGISLSALDRYLATGQGRSTTRRRAVELATGLACDRLRMDVPLAQLPEEPGAVLYLYERTTAGQPGCLTCGGRLDGRLGRRYCSSRCRQRGYRARAGQSN